MKKMDPSRCSGCRDDFYNDRNPLGVKKCWSFDKAKLVTRFETGTHTVPTWKGAFKQVDVPNCYHAQGRHFSDRLPDFVKVEDVINYSRKRKAAGQ